MKGIRITSKVDGFRRGGIAHPAQPTDHPADAFTAAQLKAIKAEPNLLVEEVELKDEKKKGEKSDKSEKGEKD